MTVSKYLHGSHPDEQTRLSQLNILLNQRCIEKLAIQNGDTILDLGAGLGQFTRAMAREAGYKGQVIGIEGDENQYRKALYLAKAKGEENLVDFQLGDITKLSLNEEIKNRFDWVHARFVLEHINRPQALVHQMFASCKVGGKVVLVDDDHANFRCYPEPPSFDTLWKAYCRSYDRLGNDPYIGRRLVSLMRVAGAKTIEADVIFFGSTFDQDNFQAYAKNLIGILEGAKIFMIENGLIQEGLFDYGIEELKTWSQHPEATIWYATNWACGVRA